MKRALLFLPALLAAIGLGAAAPVGASVSCTSNIVDGSAEYGQIQIGPTTLAGTISTGVDTSTPAATCKSVSYNAIISYTSGGMHVVQVAAQKGDGTSSFLRFSFSPVTSDDAIPTFCVALFSSKGHTILDIAPTSADLSAAPVPIADSTAPDGYRCDSGWVPINATDSSGGGASGFAG